MGRRIAFRIPIFTIATLAAGPAAAHEAWLLTPDEIVRLAAEPMPALFASHLWLGLAALAGGVATAVALRAEETLAPVEARLAAPVAPRAADLGPLAIRGGLAAMLALAATGGLPRHGTLPWTEPTLLVPDMQLALAPGWGWLAAAQMMLAAALALGLCTRIAGLAVVALSVLGLAVFGGTFLSYAPHFSAPGLILALLGGGALSVDRQFGAGALPAPAAALIQPGWRLAQVLVGAGFVYLAVAYKLTQPTLLIAILEHGEMPTFGLPMPLIALAMTGVEIVCGALLIVGRLVRPVSLTIIGAITFLALVLGETPLFHANLYGIMVVFAFAGRTIPMRAAHPETFLRRAEA